MGDEAIDSDLVASGPGEDHPPGAMLMLCAVILLAGATEGTSAACPRGTRSPEEPRQAQFPYDPPAAFTGTRASNGDVEVSHFLGSETRRPRCLARRDPACDHSQKLGPELGVKRLYGHRANRAPAVG